MGPELDDMVRLVAKLSPDGFDPLIGAGGPIRRAHSIVELGARCSLVAADPPGANAFSARSAMGLFGAGLIDDLADATILANAAAEAEAIRGVPNRVGGRLGRFGWKAQEVTLAEFVGGALRNELGITNPVAPADITAPHAACAGEGADLEDDGRVAMGLTSFLRALVPAPPSEACLAAAAPGAARFEELGCAGCHAPALAGPRGPVRLYSDLLLHDMGRDLDDGFVQHGARGVDWRTAPLWGVGQRLRFLHDGRAGRLEDAILLHGGQAAAASQAFRALDPTAREALLAFLRCL